MDEVYYLSENDHSRPNWVLFEPAEEARRKRSEAIPATVNALLGPRPESPRRIKPAYASLRCHQCGRFDANQAFDVGFDGKVSIHIRGDFGHTSDRILVVTDAFLAALREFGVSGYETKSIGTTGWHALRITVLVKANPEVFRTSGTRCPECARPEESWGTVVRVSDLDVPKATNTLFTTEQGCASAPFFDRSIFLSGKLARALKNAGIKGGYCKRLPTDREWHWVEDFRKRGIPKEVRGTTVYLSGATSR